MLELPDENLRDFLPIAKRIAIAQGVPDNNITSYTITDGLHARHLLQPPWVRSNEDRTKPNLCINEVPQVHFHVHLILKPAANLELPTGWPAKSMDEELQKVLFEEIFWEMKSKLTEEPERDLAV